MSRVQVQPTKQPKDRTVEIGYYERKDGRQVEVTSVYTDDDEPVVEYRSQSGLAIFKTAADFLKEYRRIVNESEFWKEMWEFPPPKEQKQRPRMAEPRDAITGEPLVRN